MSFFNIIGSAAVICTIAGFLAWLSTRDKYSTSQQLFWLAVVYFIPIIGPVFFIYREWNDRNNSASGG